jgi:hypothetical protein
MSANESNSIRSFLKAISRSAIFAFVISFSVSGCQLTNQEAITDSGDVIVGALRFQSLCSPIGPYLSEHQEPLTYDSLVLTPKRNYSLARRLDNGSFIIPQITQNCELVVTSQTNEIIQLANGFRNLDPSDPRSGGSYRARNFTLEREALCIDNQRSYEFTREISTGQKSSEVFSALRSFRNDIPDCNEAVAAGRKAFNFSDGSQVYFVEIIEGHLFVEIL